MSPIPSDGRSRRSAAVHIAAWAMPLLAAACTAERPEGGNGGRDASQTGIDGGSPVAPDAPVDACAEPELVNEYGGAAAADTGFEWCATTDIHRARAVACPASEPEADGTACHVDEGDTCGDDRDCTEKPRGRCWGGCSPGDFCTPCSCLYECRSDEDCEPGSYCSCTGSLHLCRAAECRTDSDCGSELCVVTDYISGCEEWRVLTCQPREGPCLKECESGQYCAIVEGQPTCTYGTDCSDYPPEP